MGYGAPPQRIDGEADLPECLRGRIDFVSKRNLAPERRKLYLRIPDLAAREPEVFAQMAARAKEALSS